MNPMAEHRSIFTLLMLLSLLGLGCAAPLAPLDGKLSGLNSYRQGEPRLDVSITDWEKRFTPIKGSVEFSIVKGDEQGSTIEYTTSAEKDKQWTMTLKDHSTFTWQLEDAGFTCSTNIDVPSGTTSIFTPPLLVVPRDLKPGQPVTTKGTIVVNDTAPPSKNVASGTWTISITHDADISLKLGDTVYDCARIKTVYTADLGLATVSRTSYDFYAADAGWVCEVFDQTVTKVIIPSTTTGTWIRK